MTITHSKVSLIADGGDSTVVQPSDWNDEHVVADGYFLPRKKIAILTNDEIITLPGLPVEIIPAPGDGKVIIPIRCVMSSAIDVSYTNIGETLGIFLSIASRYEPVFGVPDLNLSTVIFSSSLVINFNPGITRIYQTGDAEVTVGIASDRDARSYSAAKASNYTSNENLPLTLYVDNYGPDYDPDLGNFTGGDSANIIKVIVIYDIIDL